MIDFFVAPTEWQKAPCADLWGWTYSAEIITIGYQPCALFGYPLIYNPHAAQIQIAGLIKPFYFFQRRGHLAALLTSCV